MNELTSLVLERVRAMPPAEKARAKRKYLAQPRIWAPNAGPQMDAYFSEADELLYGGEPGGGKTDLGLGLAFTAHKRALLLRRQYTDLSFLVERAIQINGSRNGFSGQPPPRMRTDDGRMIDFGAAAKVGDEQHWMGNPHDLIVGDEATQFARMQIRFLMGWLRSDDPKQRCRVVLATNPALRPEGLWVNEAFAPWLDPTFPNPAKPGELRWYISGADDIDRWVDGPGSYEISTEDGKRMVQAKSRTYIPAAVKDNPHYVASGYQKQLDAMPESIRRILLGGFKVTFKDVENQVIPTKWLQAAMERWTQKPPTEIPMCTIAADCTGGGDDPLMIGWRHDGWFSPLVEVAGRDVPADRIGSFTAGQIISHRRDDADMVLDMGGGYGGSAYEHLRANNLEVDAYKGAEKSTRRTLDKKLGFTNKRSASLWKFREALDPGQSGGSPIALPNDQRLLADLAAPTFEVTPQGIKVESKEDVCARLGRSTDRGDVVVMLWSSGPTRYTSTLEWIGGRDDGATEQGFAMRQRTGRPQAVMSARQAARGRRSS